MNGWYGLLAFLVGFVLAQSWKFVAGLARGEKGAAFKNFRTAIGYMMQSGGMPSGHSASMSALTTYLGLVAGFDSGIFALAVATTIIVVYDAVHVRYAVGEQGRALNELLREKKRPALPIVEGHTVGQALVGIILGVGVGCLVYGMVRMIGQG